VRAPALLARNLAAAKIIKSQRPDFLGKKFGFCSGQTAIVDSGSRDRGA